MTASQDVQPSAIVEDRPFWPVAAAFLAAGVGVFVLGLLTTLAEAVESLKAWLQFSDPVGPLSGKTTIGTLAFFVSWPVLHLAFRGRSVSERAVYGITAVLVGAGLVMTFPTFFEQFALE